MGSHISNEEFFQCLRGTDTEDQQSNSWAESRSAELCRIFNVFKNIEGINEGPTLDIASGGGTFYRPMKKYLPKLLPYKFTDLNGNDRRIDGDLVEGCHYECDKDLLPFEDKTFGLVLLCDVIEHLLIDPMWTLIEINRVLRMGGHFVLSTPNIICLSRAIQIFAGHHPGTEHCYKPTSIYDRHNREWTPFEVITALEGIGFSVVFFDSNIEALSNDEKQLLDHFRGMGLVQYANEFYGPDLVFVMKKESHVTLETPLEADQRWPQFLYTGYDNYRQRPKVFPKF